MTVGNTSGGPSFSKYLSASDQDQIASEVAKAEAGTYGEVVSMVVGRSSGWKHLPMLAGASMTAVFFAAHMFCVVHLEWSDNLFSRFLQSAWALPVEVIIAMFFGFLFSHWPWMARHFIGPHEKLEAVHQRAELEFYRNHFDTTTKHAAVLLFVSVFERQVVVLADPQIAGQMTPEQVEASLQPIVQKLRAGLRTQNWCQGFVEAVRATGVLLKQHVPAPADYKHELPDRVIFKD